MGLHGLLRDSFTFFTFAMAPVGLRINKNCAGEDQEQYSRQKDIPPAEGEWPVVVWSLLSLKRKPCFWTCTCLEEQKSWSCIPKGLETKNYFTGEGQQQFNRPLQSGSTLGLLYCGSILNESTLLREAVQSLDWDQTIARPLFHHRKKKREQTSKSRVEFETTLEWSKVWSGALGVVITEIGAMSKVQVMWRCYKWRTGRERCAHPGIGLRGLRKPQHNFALQTNIIRYSKRSFSTGLANIHFVCSACFPKRATCSIFSFFSLFWKNKSKLMRSPCCLCFCV
jgi:hypothetical protein